MLQLLNIVLVISFSEDLFACVFSNCLRPTTGVKKTIGVCFVEVPHVSLRSSVDRFCLD